MAKKHSGGPGTYTQGGVNCTMDAPFGSASPSMPSNHMKGQFGQAPAASKIPVKMYESQGKTGSVGAGSVAPSQQGNKRTGTKEYPYGGGSMRDGKSSGRP